jgi:large subunit ribosomal protein L24
MSTQKFKTNRFAPKYHVKTGDKVIVISGDNKGDTGTVSKILTKDNKAIVDGINLVKKHTKATENNPGGINEIAAPISLSKLQLVDPTTGKGSRIGRKVVDGNSVRYFKKSGEIVK